MNAQTLIARRIVMPRTAGPPIASLAIVAVVIESISAHGLTASIGDLALLAVLVAAAERRHVAMLMAAGIACGLVVYGAMLLPLAIGVAIQRKVRARLFALVPA